MPDINRLTDVQSRLTIDRVETVLLDGFPNLLFVRLYAGDIVGLGETFFGAQSVANWIHETAAPLLLGSDPLAIERHWYGLDPFLGFKSTSVENRGRSAVDLALWDILGKVCDVPIYQLLGGAYRPSVRLYNTCAGYRYVRDTPGRAGLTQANWGTETTDGPYEDLAAFLTDAGALAESLLSEGIRGMKIWPFDLYVGGDDGNYISNAELKKGLEPFQKIRNAVGDRIEIMVEMHSLWSLPAAVKIAQALEEFAPAWIEDPIKMSSMDVLQRFREASKIPVAASETLGTRWAFRDLLESRATDIVIFDPSWTGGITESKKIVDMTEAFHLPVAPHACSGPVEFTASVHLTVNARSAIFQESVRAFYSSWYNDLVTELPAVTDGYVSPPSGPGLGTELQPGLLRSEHAHIRSSTLAASG